MINRSSEGGIGGANTLPDMATSPKLFHTASAHALQDISVIDACQRRALAAPPWQHTARADLRAPLI